MLERQNTSPVITGESQKGVMSFYLALSIGISYVFSSVTFQFHKIG